MGLNIVKLEAAHHLRGFASRRPTLDEWLRTKALQAQRSESAVTYVALLDDVVGYVSLANGSVLPDDMNERLQKGMGRFLPVPVLLLARLAVCVTHEGQGIGSTLLLHAMRLAAGVADQVGVRALVVNPIDTEAASFYARFDFQPLQGLNPPMMYLLTKDIRKLIATYDAVRSAGLRQ